MRIGVREMNVKSLEQLVAHRKPQVRVATVTGMVATIGFMSWLLPTMTDDAASS